MIYKALVKDDQNGAVSVVSCDVESIEEMHETLSKNGYIPFKSMVKPMEDFDMLMELTCYDTSLTPIWEEENGVELSSNSLNYLLGQCKEFNREFKHLKPYARLTSTTKINALIDYLKSIGKEVNIRQSNSGHYLYEGDII